MYGHHFTLDLDSRCPRFHSKIYVPSGVLTIAPLHFSYNSLTLRAVDTEGAKQVGVRLEEGRPGRDCAHLPGPAALEGLLPGVRRLRMPRVAHHGT